MILEPPTSWVIKKIRMSSSDLGMGATCYEERKNAVVLGCIASLQKLSSAVVHLLFLIVETLRNFNIIQRLATPTSYDIIAVGTPL